MNQKLTEFLDDMFPPEQPKKNTVITPPRTKREAAPFRKYEGDF